MRKCCFKFDGIFFAVTLPVAEVESYENIIRETSCSCHLISLSNNSYISVKAPNCLVVCSNLQILSKYPV